TGFDMAEVKELFGSGSMENVEEDNFDEEKALSDISTPTTQNGDLWILGNHRLLCGDSTSEVDVRYVLDGQLADLMVTDPPYNVNYGDSVEFKTSEAKSVTRKDSTIANDNLSDEDFYEFLFSFYKAAFANMKEGGSVYVFHSTKETLNFTNAMIKAGFKYAQTLVWVKNHFTLGRQDYQWIHEPILYGWKEGKGHYFIDDRTLQTAIEDSKLDFKKLTKTQMQELLEKVFELQISAIYANKPSRSPDHPTMKPIVLCAKLIYNSSHEGDTVYEPFGGSGSTLIACFIKYYKTIFKTIHILRIYVYLLDKRTNVCYTDGNLCKLCFFYLENGIKK
ncbi:MAG: site-specific DNA-methyltransferase, partial [Clostridia bacterium]